MFKTRELTGCMARRDALLYQSQINRHLYAAEMLRIQCAVRHLEAAIALAEDAVTLWCVAHPPSQAQRENGSVPAGLLAKARKAMTLARCVHVLWKAVINWPGRY